MYACNLRRRKTVFPIKLMAKNAFMSWLFCGPDECNLLTIPICTGWVCMESKSFEQTSGYKLRNCVFLFASPAQLIKQHYRHLPFQPENVRQKRAENALNGHILPAILHWNVSRVKVLLKLLYAIWEMNQNNVIHETLIAILFFPNNLILRCKMLPKE